MREETKGTRTAGLGGGWPVSSSKLPRSSVLEFKRAMSSFIMALDRAKAVWATYPQSVWLPLPSKMAAPTESGVVADGRSGWLFLRSGMPTC